MKNRKPRNEFAVKIKTKFNSTAGHKGQRIGVDKEDRYKN